MKVLPFILSGLAAVSLGVSAQQYDTAPFIENVPPKDEAPPPVASQAQKPGTDTSANASAGASRDAKTGKPKKANRKPAGSGGK